MCTVSFVNTKEITVITSNRNDKVKQFGAIPPKNYVRGGRNVFFPTDPKEGGTWCAVDEKGTVLVLLNGADKNYEVKSVYRKSRGLIVLDIIDHESPKDFWQIINLESIEPFTLVLYQDNRLFQLRWDGLEKGAKELDAKKNHIWSSVTLYPEEVSKNKTNWFYTFLGDKVGVLSSNMNLFNRQAKGRNKENGLVTAQDEELQTVNITQVVIGMNRIMLDYYDLTENQEFSTSYRVD